MTADGRLADVAEAAAAGLACHRDAELGGGGEGGQVGGGVRVADRVAVLIEAGLGEAAAQLDLAGAGLSARARSASSSASDSQDHKISRMTRSRSSSTADSTSLPGLRLRSHAAINGSE